MQKVRGASKPELKHLFDVIVFPSRGVFPLAEWMQNGTSDPAIVDNFENTPSPPSLPSPESFGIQVDNRKLDDTFVTSNKKAIREFLDLNLNFRCIASLSVEALAGLHDLLVDSSKMGYTFTEDQWKKLIATDPRITHKNPDEPLHKRLLGGASAEDIHSVPKNAVDRLLLRTVIPAADAIAVEVRDLWKKESIKDEAFYRPLRTVQLLAEEEPEYHEDLGLLVKGIKKIHNTWKLKIHRNTDSANSVACIEDCHDAFRSLMPTTAHQEMEILISPSPTAWHLLKVAVAYVEYPAEAFALRMAGKELGFIKAWSIEGHGRFRRSSIQV